MLNFGPEKMLVISFIALLVLGPDKLPEVARKVGKIMGELRRMSSGFQDEMRRAIEDTTGSAGLQEIKQDLTDTVRQATTLPTGANAPQGVPDAAVSAAIDDRPGPAVDGDH